jgi:glutaminase
LNEYKKLAGGGYIGFNNATYKKCQKANQPFTFFSFLSEKKTADRNYALSYYMKENKYFPAGIESIREELDFYFQLCSLETHCESAAVSKCGSFPKNRHPGRLFFNLLKNGKI